MDQDREQLENIHDFLASRGIASSLSDTWREGRQYFELAVAEGDNVLELLRQMLRYVDKKHSQVEAAIDYLEDSITGGECIEVMNDAIRKGKRSSDIRSVEIPYTKSIGLRLGRSVGRWRKGALSEAQLKAVRRDRDSKGMSFELLAAKYGVAASTAWRAVKLNQQGPASS